MRRDLHVMEPILYRGTQELRRAQAPQLAVVMLLAQFSDHLSRAVW